MRFRGAAVLRKKVCPTTTWSESLLELALIDTPPMPVSAGVIADQACKQPPIYSVAEASRHTALAFRIEDLRFTPFRLVEDDRALLITEDHFNDIVSGLRDGGPGLVCGSGARGSNPSELGELRGGVGGRRMISPVTQ